MKAIITIGISASGKSTHAREWVTAGTKYLGDTKSSGAPIYNFTRTEINRDNFRKQLMIADGRFFSWAKWNWKREKEVDVLVNSAIVSASEAGKDIICSDTNLSESRRAALITKLEGLGYEVEIKEFPITLEEAWKRDAAREDGVGHSVIAEQYEKWLAYKGRKVYEPKKHLPKCILVDVDGTLAHMNGKRGAFEWDKVGVDDVDEQVRMLVNLFGKVNGNHVIVLSGRDGCSQMLTERWLSANGIEYDSIFMRAANDMRKDTIVKEEIFWRDIADKYYVQFVVDDRPSVARMWRELGVKVFQVGNPHIEF